ncbi:MAG: hypothetical protein Q7N50_00650 [Armatimonadota bacterium]|nr:hypothetical protein [Armatimonadota bacterium]
MALIILAIIAALIILAAIHGRDKRMLAVFLAIITFSIVPLFYVGSVPLRALFILVKTGRLPLLIAGYLIAFLVLGGIGLLINAYNRTSGDVRWVKMAFSSILSAILIGFAYMAFAWLILPQASVKYTDLAGVLGVGVLVGLVVSFALTHERPSDCLFFQSRDGGTALAASLGAVASMGGLNIILQQLPGPGGVQVIVVNLVTGALLGAGLTIPLRAIEAGRLVRSVLGAIIGCLILTAIFQSRSGASSLVGLVAGAAVGALLPDERESKE